MTKQLIALAIAAAFGIAHAADTGTTGINTSPTTGNTSKTGPDAAVGKAPEAKDSAPSAAMSSDQHKTTKKTHKRTHKKSAAKSGTTTDTTK